LDVIFKFQILFFCDAEQAREILVRRQHLHRGIGSMSVFLRV
jgi:hypothetical protein